MQFGQNQVKEVQTSEDNHDPMDHGQENDLWSVI